MELFLLTACVSIAVSASILLKSNSIDTNELHVGLKHVAEISYVTRKAACLLSLNDKKK